MQSKAVFTGDKLIGGLKKVIDKKSKHKILADDDIIVDLPKVPETLLDEFEIELEKEKQAEKDLIDEFNL